MINKLDDLIEKYFGPDFRNPNEPLHGITRSDIIKEAMEAAYNLGVRDGGESVAIAIASTE